MKLVMLALMISAFEPLDDRPARSAVSLTFAVYSSTPDTVDVASTARTRIDALWLGLQDARLRAVTACKGDAKAIVAGAVRHYATTTETKLEIARYCKFEVKLRRTADRATGAPNELKNASIVVEGRRSDGVPFTIRSRLEIVVSLRATDLEGFAISESGSRWIAGVDIARWLENIELLDAPASEGARGQTVVIDEKSNPELLARFNLNVESGVALFEDRDGDRTLDAEERERPLAIRR